MSNHKDKETAAPVVPTNPDEVSTNFEEYAQQAELPTYAAPLRPSYNYPLIQYGKKVNVVSGAKPKTYTGWLIAIEQDAILDDILEQQGVPLIRIRHQNKSEDSYWQFDSIKGYFLFQAIPTSYGQDAWRETGVAYVWNEYVNTYSYGSQLQCMFFMKGLLEIGYHQPLVITLSRTVTQHFVNRVLRRYEAMTTVIAKALNRQGKTAYLSSYAYWVELLKDSEEVSTNGGITYFAPITTIPSPLTVGYVKAHETPAEHIPIIESFLPILPQWAEAASLRLQEPPRQNGIAATQEQDEAEAAVEE